MEKAVPLSLGGTALREKCHTTFYAQLEAIREYLSPANIFCR